MWLDLTACLFSCFHTWSEAICRWLGHGPNSPCGRSVEFLLLASERYLLKNHKRKSQTGSKRQIPNISVLPLSRSQNFCPLCLKQIDAAVKADTFAHKTPTFFYLSSHSLSVTLIFLCLSFISVSVAISPSSVAVWRLGCCHRNPTWPCLLPGCTRRLKPTAQPYWRLTTCLQLFCGWQIFFSAFVLSLTYVHTHQDQHAHTLTSSVWSFAAADLGKSEDFYSYTNMHTCRTANNHSCIYLKRRFLSYEDLCTHKKQWKPVKTVYSVVLEGLFFIFFLNNGNDDHCDKSFNYKLDLEFVQFKI